MTRKYRRYNGTGPRVNEDTRRKLIKMRNSRRCTWCEDPNAEEWDDGMCRDHEAEYEDLSVAELDRRDAEQYAEEADAKGWR